MKCKLLFLSILFATLSCTSQSDIVSIDGHTIAQEDVAYRLAIDRAYGNDRSTATEVILQLIMQALREVVAEKEHIHVSDSMIEQEAMRIDRETKAPAILVKVKDVFSKHRDYLKHYVRPILIERSLQERFFFDTLYQEEPYTIIKDAFVRSETKVLSSDSVLKVFEPSNEQLAYYEKSAGKSIGEDKYSYFFVRQKAGKKVVYIIPKNDYTKWLHTEALKISVVVNDEELKEKLLKRTESSQFWQKLLNK